MPHLASNSNAQPAHEPNSLMKSRRAQTGERVPEVSALVIAAAQHPLFTLSFALAAAFGCIALAVTIVKAQYHATSYIQVRQREDYLLSSQASRAEDQAFVKSQRLIVTQQQILAQALAGEELQAELGLPATVANIDWLRNQIEVQIPSGSEVMTITGMHTDPEIAWKISQAVTQCYLENVTNSLRESRKSRIEELERAAKQVDLNLSTRWSTLHSMADRLGAGNPASLVVNEQVQLQNFREATQQMRSLQMQRSQLEIQLSELRRKKDKSQFITDEHIRAVAMQRPDVLASNNKLLSMDIKIREFRQLAANENSARLVSLVQERDFYAKQIETMIAELLPSIRRELEEERDALQQVDISGIEQQIALLSQEEEYIRKSREEQKVAIVDGNGSKGVDLEMLRHEIEREERLANNLWQTISELKIEDQAKPRVALIELAKRPESPVRTKQFKTAGVAGLLGVILAVFAIGYYEWSLCRIRNPQDIADHLPIEIYGENTVPKGLGLWGWRSRSYQKLVGGVSEVAAQLILTSQVQGRLPCIFVTAATDAEPRDSISIELARVLAHAGHRTLLIDCDFQSNVLPKRFGLPISTPDSCRIMRINLPTLEDFDYLRGDGENTVSMTMPNGFQSLLEEIRKSYSAIVVHGPPILTCAESVLLATQVDTTLFAVLPEVSRWNLMNAAFHRLQYAGASVLGCVFHTKTLSGNVKSRRAQLATADQSGPIPLTMEEQLQRELQNIRADLARVASSAPTKDSKSPSGPSPSRNHK